MVDGLERSDAQRIAALEARVAELERGNPTCVCGAKREEFPLPWRKERRYDQMWAIVAANDWTICAGMSEDRADRILSLASRLEAAERVVGAAKYAIESFNTSAKQIYDENKWFKLCMTGSMSGLESALSAYDKSTLAPVDG